MANITKTQVKKRANEVATLIEDSKYEEAKDALESLKDDVREEADSIEPYNGKDDLTPKQQERQEWFEDTAQTLESMYDDIEDAIETINGKVDELNCIE